MVLSEDIFPCRGKLRSFALRTGFTDMESCNNLGHFC